MSQSNLHEQYFYIWVELIIVFKMRLRIIYALIYGQFSPAPQLDVIEINDLRDDEYRGVNFASTG